LEPEAIIWTEGKTDWQHLKRAFQVLGNKSRIAFKEFEIDFGDDQLLKQCAALAHVPQEIPAIFIFDRDKDDTVKKVTNGDQGYKAWGNNVFSFAIPIPTHRRDQQGICIEFYYTDDELRTTDEKGRRLYLSSEFNLSSGRSLSDPNLSVGNKGKLSTVSNVRILDSDVFDAQSRNVALSKSDFAKNVVAGIGAFSRFRFDAFRAIFATVDEIVVQTENKFDLPFGDSDLFIASLKEKDPAQSLAAIVEASIRICKLTMMAFAAATLRHYEKRIVDESGADAKKVRPIKKVLSESFANPSLADLQKLARYSYHLIDEHAPSALHTLRSIIGQNPTLGPIGDLLDLLERLFPPPRRQVRIVNKGQLKKPLLDYVIPELSKYEGRLVEIVEKASAFATSEGVEKQSWILALSMLIELLKPLGAFTFRVRNIERVRNNSDEFDVLLTTYKNGRMRLQQVNQTYQDLKDDRLETYELVADENESIALDLFPFIVIKNNRLSYYSRTRAHGYEYTPVFDLDGQYLIPTKRKFSHLALRATISADLQGLFWTQVAPSTSSFGVKANIPTHGPVVGRRQQIAGIMEEIIQIPNQNGIVYGPGGVGKTALLIELSRQLYEGEETAVQVIFENIIWVSAKRDYYDPTLDVVESGQPQFQTLDNVLTTILEFHEFEDASGYDLDDKKWFVGEFLRDTKTLLILDNFESVAPAGQDEIVRFFGIEIKKLLRDKPDHFKLLVTSREMIPSGFHQINLRGLDKQESKELMQRLHEPYARSGQAQLTPEQLDAVYNATNGIPLIIKHCYGQIYEYNRSVDTVLKGLSSASNKVVDFSFSEIFDLLKHDDLQLRVVLLLEVSGRPLVLRQMMDILDAEENELAERVRRLVGFQCITRSSSGTDEKYAVNDEVRFFTRRLAQEHADLAAEINRKLANLPIEKRMEYSKPEFDAAVLFLEYMAQNHYVAAEDFIRESLRKHPASLLLNLHYAKFLKEVKRRTEEAIDRLEAIRSRSGNDPYVLRLLIAYQVDLVYPNFEQAHSYARELEDLAVNNPLISMELARFYLAWSTAIKLRFESDPLKEMLRRQQYKELADETIRFLKTVQRHDYEWYYLMAHSYYNKWDYERAIRNIDSAIAALPQGSPLFGSYRRLKLEITEKEAYHNTKYNTQSRTEM
jgi:hypothetical protein